MKLDWRQGILHITTMGVEGCCLYALMTLLNERVAGGSLFIVGLLLLYPLAFGFSKLIQRLHWHRGWRYAISWLVWVIVMLLMVKIQLFSGLSLLDPAWVLAVPQAISQMLYGFKPELLILVSSAVFWWLGRRLAYLRVNFATSVGEFQFGLVILLVTLLVASQLSVNLLGSAPTVIAFFVFALSGMSVAHALEGKSWLSGFHQGRWSGLLAISISLILILGILIGSLVTPDFLQLVLNALKWGWGLVLKAIAFVASFLPTSEPPEPPPAMPSIPETGPSEGFKMWSLPERVRSGLGIGILCSILGLVLVALWRTLSRVFGWLRRKLADMSEAEVEPLPGTFRADLLGWLKRILLKLFGFVLPSWLARKPKSILPEIASVRQTYRQLLHWATIAGYPRGISQTPREYLYTLVDLLPEAEGDLAFITQQYVKTRYGTSLPTEDELYQLTDSWHRVRQNRLKKVSDQHAQE